MHRHANLLRCLIAVVAFNIFAHCASGQLSVTTYGAKCDWNGTAGTDDTAAFQAAANAANAAYDATAGSTSAFGAAGSIVAVQLPTGKACVVNGTVTIGSGVHFVGPGTIIVTNQTGGTLLFQNADNAGAEDLTIRVIAGPGGNNANLSVLSWRDTSSDAVAFPHTTVDFRNNTVIDGSWGIYVTYSSGSSSLENVDISGNTVMSTTTYTNADGIHVNGNVHGITINHNRVSNRGDAAIALTSGPGSSRTLSGAAVSSNTCLENITGLDNSGASDAIWSNNFVRATTSISNFSNPAARSIPYVGITPYNVKFIGNHLENYQGTNTDPAAKVDDTGSNLVTNVDWIGNTIVGTYAMWFMGNTIALHDNTFSPGATIYLEYDSADNYPGQNIMIGRNYWLGNGTISEPGNPDLYVNNSLANQQTNGTVTIVGTFKSQP